LDIKGEPQKFLKERRLKFHRIFLGKIVFERIVGGLS
jgi:hypothetical protein